jgi:hypothetical protein
MPPRDARLLTEPVRALARREALRAAGDADLLAAFIRRRDDAFAELVRRHGPAVWAVCRRRLSNVADTEDAFQATFLVLARRAETLRRPASLPARLFGIRPPQRERPPARRPRQARRRGQTPRRRGGATARPPVAVTRTPCLEVKGQGARGFRIPLPSP